MSDRYSFYKYYIELGEYAKAEVIRVTSSDMPGPDYGNAGWTSLLNFISTVQSAPNMMRSSVECPLEVTIKHDGKAWVLESKAIIKSEKPKPEPIIG